MLKESKNKEEIIWGTLRLKGTALFASLLAKRRKLNEEICIIAAMLYEYGIYKIKKEVSTRVCAAEAERLLRMQGCFERDEIDLISDMILNCRNYDSLGNVYEELLKDSDMLLRYLYIESREGCKSDNLRIDRVLQELNIE